MARAIVIDISAHAIASVKLGDVLVSTLEINKSGKKGDCIFRDKNGKTVDVNGLKLAWEEHSPDS